MLRCSAFASVPGYKELLAQGNFEDICELEVKRHGLVQIFRAGESFAGRIFERMGPFSRSTTVPLFCKGFSDPEESMRGLAHLPQSALHHRVHVLSDQNSGVGKFIYVGDLGLLGGGDREPPSSSDARGHQTVAESSASCSATQRDLTRSERDLVRRVFAKRSYRSLDEVVKAFNETDDNEQKVGLVKVMHKIVYALNDMPIEDATDNRGAIIRECLAMCRLHSAGGEHLLLHKEFFDGLRDMLCGDTLNDRHVMEAIEHTLQGVDTEVFENDPSCLVQLADSLFAAFDPDSMSFSRETFPVQCSSMHALFECVRILHDVSSGGWDPEKLEGLDAKFADWCRRVIDLSEYYPLNFQATLVEQSLTSLRTSKGANRNANNARRIANLARGWMGKYRAVRKAIHLDFDLGKPESVTRAPKQALAQALKQARHSNIVWNEQCRTYHHALNTACFAAMEDPSNFEAFNDLVSSIVLEQEASNREHCKALRFGVVQMLNMLSIHGKAAEVRGTSAETLVSFVERTDEWDWASDADLFSELLDNLAELGVQGHDDEKRAAQVAIGRLISLAHNPECEEALFKWQAEEKNEEELDSLSSGQSRALDSKLFSQVWKSLEDEVCLATAEGHSRPKNDHSLVSPYIVRYFAGRKEEFEKLINAFTTSSEAVVTKAIVGPGGIGKTQLAIKVFERLRNTCNYDKAFWIPSDSRESLFAAFLQIADYLIISAYDEIAVLVKRVHQELGRSRCLYVFDDAPDLDMIRTYLPPQAGHVIVTTRDVGVVGWERDTVQLGPFDECEAWFLAKQFGYTQSANSEGLDDLLELFPLYPLTLAQFFSMMKYEGVSSPAEWFYQAERYAPPTKSEDKAVKMLSAKHDVRGASAMVFLFRSSVLSISNEHGDLGTHCLDILSKLALLDPNGVPIDWVYKWYEHEDLQTKIRTQKSIRLLERYSYVSWNAENNQIYIHAETQLLARQLLLHIDEITTGRAEERKEEAGDKARDQINIVLNSIVQSIGDLKMDCSNRESQTSLTRNMISLLEQCEKSQNISAEFALVRIMGRIFAEICMFSESLKFNKRALEMCERIRCGEDNPELVSCIVNCSISLSKMGRDREGLPLIERALGMCERVHGEVDHPDLVRCIREYAIALSKLGRYNEALPFDKKALDMCERLHGGKDHEQLADCIREYAIELSKLGRYSEALPFDKKAVEMYERIHGGADHPDLADCIREYAISLSKIGEDDEALPLLRRALKMCERIHGGVDHPDLIRCIQNYGALLAKTGSKSQALPLLKKAVEMFKRLHKGADHPERVNCIRNYAVLLSMLNRNNEALPHLREALEMCERIHGGADHPDLVDCLKEYAFGLARMERHIEKVILLKEAEDMLDRLGNQ